MILKGRTLNGSRIDLVHEDRGLVDGQYESRWLLKDRHLVVRVPDGSGLFERTEAEGAALREAGIDPNTLRTLDGREI